MLIKALLEHKEDIFYYCQGYYRAFMRGKEIADYPFFDIANPIKTED